MAKKKISYSFSKATLSKENEQYILEEFSKDGSEMYNLTDILEQLLDVDGIGISISSEDAVPTVAE